MRVKQSFVMATAVVLGAALVTPAAPGSAATSDSVMQRTISQIAALSKEKLARTATERKVDSRLLAEIAMQSGAPVASGIKKVQTGIGVSHGQVTVDLQGTLTDAVLNRVRDGGGSVQNRQPKAGVARVTLPLDEVLATAALPQVTHIAPPAAFATATMTRPGTRPVFGQPSKQERRATITRDLHSALSGRIAAPQALPGGQGSVVSEAVRVEGVDKARNKFGVSGVGVTVGVLSDGVDSLTDSQDTGDLPPDVNVLPGQAGSGDEGTAMLELVHDIAPGAHLAFATNTDDDPGQFADNIRALRTAGADIIVDDVIFLNESPFQDGPIAQAVNDVTADGALYFSSAGNQGNKDDGTSGTWEGDFVSSGKGLGKLAGTMHDFAPGAGVQTSDPIAPTGIFDEPVDLFWSDPLGGATSDYDFYVVDLTGDVTAFSNDVQDGTQDPFEITLVGGADLSIVVVKFAGADRFLHLDAFNGRFIDQPDQGLTAYSTDGVLRGHAATAAAFATAAAPAGDPLPFDLEPGDPPNPSGPFPGVFTRSQLSERFTADGPRRVFFNEDGSAITPGNFSSTGGVVRLKPQITAADGVSTSLADFTPFFGTSAAAPNAAAIAALVLSGNPGISPTAVRSAILASALDIEAPGNDRDTGAGILMANRLLNRTGATPQPYVFAGTPVLGASTDGDPFLEPGESAPLNIPVTNTGDALARQVRVALSTPTAGVTITPASRAYNRVAKNATKLSPRTWTIRLSRSYPLGQPVDLRASVSFLGGLSPTSAELSIPTGQPDPVVHNFFYTRPPVPIPDDDVAGATVKIPVSGVGPVSRTTFSVDGTVCSTTVGSTTVGIDHTFVNDLAATLTSPSGTTVAVFAFINSSDNNICQAVFDDTAARSIDDATSDEAPFTGTWRPTEPLSSFTGEVGDGTWEFKVIDAAPDDTGSIRSVSLHLSGFVTGP